MFWTTLIVVVALLAIVGWWSGRRGAATARQLETRRRHLGIHQGNGTPYDR